MDVRADTVGLAHVADMGQQPDPGGLRDVLGIVRVEPVSAGDGADARVEAAEERVPRALVAGGRAVDEPVQALGVVDLGRDLMVLVQHAGDPPGVHVRGAVAKGGSVSPRTRVRVR